MSGAGLGWVGLVFSEQRSWTGQILHLVSTTSLWSKALGLTFIIKQSEYTFYFHTPHSLLIDTVSLVQLFFPNLKPARWSLLTYLKFYCYTISSVNLFFFSHHSHYKQTKKNPTLTTKFTVQSNLHSETFPNSFPQLTVIWFCFKYLFFNKL